MVNDEFSLLFRTETLACGIFVVEFCSLALIIGFKTIFCG